jgi:hypothetical protein
VGRFDSSLLDACGLVCELLLSGRLSHWLPDERGCRGLGLDLRRLLGGLGPHLPGRLLEPEILRSQSFGARPLRG